MKILFKSILILLGTAGLSAMGGTYSTTFPLTETPISESGEWINGGVVGLDWNDCATVEGMAIGSGGHDYSDSTALLAGTWGSNQDVTVTLYRGPNVVEDNWPEVEIRLRSSLSPHVCTGYEILYSLKSDANCYVSIVRWNGALGDFTQLIGASGVQFVSTNGSTLRATAIGNTISLYQNGILLMSAVDDTFTDGSPGIGFDSNSTSFDYTTFGFTGFAATDGITTTKPVHGHHH